MLTYQLTLTDYTLMSDLFPAYLYDSLELIEQTHSIYRQFHYVDCDCAECYKAHYPCDDPDCDYCSSVKLLKYEFEGYGWDKHEVFTGRKIERSEDNIIDYRTYMEFFVDADYPLQDILWRKCEKCDMLIHGLTSQQFSGYCSQTCMDNDTATEEEEEEEVVVDKCKFCEQNTPSEDHKYLCDECLENSEHGYEIYTDDMEYYSECWIDQQGNIYSVNEDYGGHNSAAIIIGFADEDECFESGYVKCTDTYGSSWYSYRNITNDQADVIMEICQIKEVEYPGIVKDWINGHEIPEDFDYDQYTESVKMQDLSPVWMSMKRSDHDRFYPLSGD